MTRLQQIKVGLNGRAVEGEARRKAAGAAEAVRRMEPCAERMGKPVDDTEAGVRERDTRHETRLEHGLGLGVITPKERKEARGDLDKRRFR